MYTRFVCSFVLSTVAACAPSAQMAPAPIGGGGAGAEGLEVRELTRIESSPAAGTLMLRVANNKRSPILVGVDVRAEPGMWLGPARQETGLFYVPPEGERVVSVPYAFPHLSPEAILHVRVGVPEEHAGGWVHIPEPTVVRRFRLGGTDSARAFLGRFEMRAGRHLTVYALRGMFSSEQLDSIAAERDHAVSELSRMLAVRAPPGLALVFYPDATSKAVDTDHVGAGMTKGRILAEVFNDSVRVDPYHELAHAISGQLGWAPAWLSEGFAVYAAEYLGADALALQGSPGKTLDQAVCGFLRAGELFPMADLMQLPDIGPAESRPNVSYAQAGSFTAFLAKRFGLEPVRRAYAALAPTSTAAENHAAFIEAFGTSSDNAAELWRAHIDETCS